MWCYGTVIEKQQEIKTCHQVIHHIDFNYPMTGTSIYFISETRKNTFSTKTVPNNNIWQCDYWYEYWLLLDIMIQKRENLQSKYKLYIQFQYYFI